MSLSRNPNLFYGMGRKRRVRRRGAGFFDALKSAHDWIKSNKVISTVGNALGSVGVPYAAQIGSTAAKLGYGRRRRPIRRRVVHRRRHGAGFMDALRAAHNFVKSNKIISTVGSALAKSNVPYAGQIASTAAKLGYGRRRRRVGRRRHGAGFLDALKRAHSFVKSNKIISNVGSALAKANVPYAGQIASTAAKLGYGRRRRVVRRIRHHGGANFFSTEQIAAPRFS